MRTRVALLGGVAAAALLVAGVVGVAAQTGDSGSANPVSTFMDRLASNLGIGKDQLQAAVDKTRGQMLDDAVQQGRLTQDQADQLKQQSAGKGLGEGLGRFHSGAGAEGNHDGQPFGRGGPGMRGLAGAGLDAVASAIGIDKATLMQELASGRSLAQVAQAHGVSRDQLKQKLTDAFGSKLDELLDQTFQFGAHGGNPGATPTPSS